MKVICAWCGRRSEKRKADIVRANLAGALLYCNKRCSGRARRSDFRTKAQKRADKSEYDKERRAKLGDALREKKRLAYHEKYKHDETYKKKAAEYRQRRMPSHVEYCRKAEYKAKKHEYDLRKSSSKYGPYAECHRLLVELRREIVKRVPNYYDRHTETIKDRTRRWKDAHRRD